MDHKLGALSFVTICLVISLVQTQTAEDVAALFSNCQTSRSDLDICIKRAFNDLRPYFKTGIPELNIAPFDPHRSPFVEQRRGDRRGLGGYRLVLTNVSEYGWTNSEVTKYKTDKEHNRIVYSQYFPEKSLDGNYMFRGVVGKPVQTQGTWNLTLYKYSQTTSVTRIGGPGGLLKVRVEIDKIGDLSLHITDFLGGKKILGEFEKNVFHEILSKITLLFSESIGDFIINSMWQVKIDNFKHNLNFF